MNLHHSKTEIEYTPEPWSLDWSFIVAPDPNGIYPDIYIAEIAEEDSSEPPRIATPEMQAANGRRIVAAINACAKIPTETLEQGIIEELLYLLDCARIELEEWLSAFPQGSDQSPQILALIRTALARIQGGVVTPTRFDGYEIAPVREEEGSCEVCAPSEAHFWTLYGHIPDEGVEAIADLKTREDCETLLYRITGHREYFYNRREEQDERI